MQPTHAIVIFVDVRSMTQWMSGIASVDMLDDFLTSFYALIRTQFVGVHFKGLGDGAVLVQCEPVPPHRSATEALLLQVLSRVAAVEQGFASICHTVELHSGHSTRLRLGWGITRGMVHVLAQQQEFLGMVINEASRLCSLARPYGVVIDREDFPSLPLLSGLPFTFKATTRLLDGMSVRMPFWVSQSVHHSKGVDL